MKVGKLVPLIVSALFVFNGVAEAAPKQKTLAVGVAFRLNDKFNDTIWQIGTGIDLAKKLFERSNPGVKIELKKYTHSEDLASVETTATQIVNDRLPAVIGGEVSEESIVFSEKLEAAKTVFITPTSSNPQVTEGKDFAFRACFSDRLVADKLAKFSAEKLKPKVLGVIHNVSSPYTDFLSKQFLETFKKINDARPESEKTTVLVEKVIRDTPDFNEQVDRFIKAGVTHVVMLVHQSDLTKFVLVAGKKNFFPAYLGSDGWGSNENVSRKLITESPFGQKFLGYRNSYWNENADHKISVRFRKAYESDYKMKPSAWSAIAFDSAWVLFTAMKKAKNPKDGESIRQAMKEISDISLVTASHFHFGADNSPNKELYIYRLDSRGVQLQEVLR